MFGGPAGLSHDVRMDRQGFWDAIARARAAVDDTFEDTEELAEVLTDVLAQLQPAEIAAFDNEFRRLLIESYRDDLWAAAYLTCGGAGDDSFDYFRAWLIAQGQQAWDAALANPDSLADLINPAAGTEFDGESLMYSAGDAYERVAGTSLVPDDPPNVEWPAGLNLDFEDEAELARRFPRLAAATAHLYDEPADAPKSRWTPTALLRRLRR